LLTFRVPAFSVADDAIVDAEATVGTVRGITLSHPIERYIHVHCTVCIHDMYSMTPLYVNNSNDIQAGNI